MLHQSKGQIWLFLNSFSISWRPLESSTDPTQMLDTSFKRNILHVAAKNGKHEVVKYILLQSCRIPELDRLINQKDYRGNTPLLLAAKSCHPKAVFYLTWDERVNFHLINQDNQTALEVVNASQLRNPSTRKVSRIQFECLNVKNERFIRLSFYLLYMTNRCNVCSDLHLLH